MTTVSSRQDDEPRSTGGGTIPLGAAPPTAPPNAPPVPRPPSYPPGAAGYEPPARQGVPPLPSGVSLAPAGRRIGAYFLGIVGWITELVSLILFLTRSDRRCLHDLVAGTIVVYDPEGRLDTAS